MGPIRAWMIRLASAEGGSSPRALARSMIGAVSDSRSAQKVCRDDASSGEAAAAAMMASVVWEPGSVPMFETTPRASCCRSPCNVPVLGMGTFCSLDARAVENERGLRGPSAIHRGLVDPGALCDFFDGEFFVSTFGEEVEDGFEDGSADSCRSAAWTLLSYPGLLLGHPQRLSQNQLRLQVGSAILETQHKLRLGKGSQTVMHYDLRTDIEIDAPPETVWAVLTDLVSYSEWNPFVVSSQGIPAVGERLTNRLQPPGGRAMTFRPTVTVVETGQVFEWLGRLGFPGVFDGRHRFEIEPTPTGSRFTQSEAFSGVLVRFMRKSLDTQTLQGFRAMNSALKSRAEARSGVDV